MNRKVIVAILLGVINILAIWAFALADLSPWIETPTLFLLGAVSVLTVRLTPS